MSWADSGHDSKGRAIGYACAAVCDSPGCGNPIDRGLAYACGGSHGEDEYSCGGYYCDEHVFNAVPAPGLRIRLCEACFIRLESVDEWSLDPL